MDAREEMMELERMWRERALSDAFYGRHRESKWGERIREEVVRGIEERRPESIEDGILFLEVSPWYFRSGYHKAFVARKLKGVALTEEQRGRLRQVIWNAFEGRVGPEFNEYARLAIRVADAAFLRQVEARLPSAEGWIRGRLERVLRLCGKRRDARGN